MTAEAVADFPLHGRPPAAVAGHPDPEVVERPVRRTFTVDYKLRILAEADACAETRQVGALLRREGLYSSHLAHWRQQRDSGGRHALAQPRGRKPADPMSGELLRLQQETARLQQRLGVAEAIIAAQKNLATVLGLTLPESPRTP